MGEIRGCCPDFVWCGRFRLAWWPPPRLSPTETDLKTVVKMASCVGMEVGGEMRSRKATDLDRHDTNKGNKSAVTNSRLAKEEGTSQRSSPQGSKTRRGAMSGRSEHALASEGQCSHVVVDHDGLTVITYSSFRGRRWKAKGGGKTCTYGQQVVSFVCSVRSTM